MMLAVDANEMMTAVPTAGLVLLAVTGAAGWALLRVLGGSAGRRTIAAALLAGRLATGFVTIWLGLIATGRGLVLGTSWPLWLLAAVGAAGVEMLLGLYALERKLISRRVGFALAGLRVAAVLGVLLMLAQPVWSLVRSSDVHRYVAVVVDDSASMYVKDTQLTAGEKLGLAEALGLVSTRRPYNIDKFARSLDEIRGVLTGHADFIRGLSNAPAARQKAMEARRVKLAEDMTWAGKTLDEQLSAVGSLLSGKVKLPPQAQAVLTDAKARLADRTKSGLAQAAALAAESGKASLGAQAGTLLAALDQASAALVQVGPNFAPLQAQLDEQTLITLSPGEAAKVQQVSTMTRSAIARQLLAARGSDDKNAKSVLQGLSAASFRLLGYRFAEQADEIDPAAIQVSGELRATSAAKPAAVSTQPAQQLTDYAAVLDRVAKDTGDKQCAAVVVVGDFRQVARGNPQEMARRFSARGVPVYTLPVGSVRSPMDAGVTSVEAPETIYAKDKLLVDAGIKFDGLVGRDVKVSLFEAQREVDSKTVRPVVEQWRTHVQLADTPADLGPHTYRVVVQSFDGEATLANNEYVFTVNVTLERTKVLLIDGRPRWEFRYLKNLFADRDKTVQLQYVLTEPDRVADSPATRPVVASASRPAEETEATALPTDPAEWLKFNVIVLGDVSPDQLGKAGMEAIRKFVADRGGTLVVIAGQNYMPHAFGGTPLETLLPVTFAASASPATKSPEPSFRFALTDEGRASVMLLLKTDPLDSQAAWNALPDFYWRHAIDGAKPGATVLAYALGAGAPPALLATTTPASGPASSSVPATDGLTATAAKAMAEYQRKNVLMATHNVALGKVLFLATDYTWRLRYRAGDTYHHKFWGQILRWGDADKLPAGTNFVKVGTDHSRYGPHDAVVVKARLLNNDFSPMISENVWANVLDGNRQVLRAKLAYAQDSPGLYRATLGELPAGCYRVELDAPDARASLARDGVKIVSTGFSVDPSVPAEQVELAADPKLAAVLSSITGGAVLDASDLRSLPAKLGVGVVQTADVSQYRLWDSWPLLGLIVLVMTLEWLVRKKVGLA